MEFHPITEDVGNVITNSSWKVVFFFRKGYPNYWRIRKMSSVREYLSKLLKAESKHQSIFLLASTVDSCMYLEIAAIKAELYVTTANVCPKYTC